MNKVFKNKKDFDRNHIDGDNGFTQKFLNKYGLDLKTVILIDSFNCFNCNKCISCYRCHKCYKCHNCYDYTYTTYCNFKNYCKYIKKSTKLWF